MPLMLPKDIARTDVILQRHIHDVRVAQDALFLDSWLLPLAPVDTRSGKIIRFGKERFAEFETERSPGDTIREVSLTYTNDYFTLKQEALAGKLPIEHDEESKATGVPINLQKETALLADEGVRLKREIRVAALVTNTANYPTALKQDMSVSPAVPWSDPNSNPLGDVRRWIRTIELASGVRPNRAWATTDVADALLDHPSMRAYFQGASTETVSYNDIARILRINEFKEAASQKLDKDTGELTRIWGTGKFGLAYVPDGDAPLAPDGRSSTMTIQRDRRTPSFGYIYQLKKYPIVEDPYYNKPNRSWYFPVIDEFAPVLTMIGAGFLAYNVL